MREREREGGRERAVGHDSVRTVLLLNTGLCDKQYDVSVSLSQFTMFPFYSAKANSSVYHTLNAHKENSAKHTSTNCDIQQTRNGRTDRRTNQTAKLCTHLGVKGQESITQRPSVYRFVEDGVVTDHDYPNEVIDSHTGKYLLHRLGSALKQGEEE